MFQLNNHICIGKFAILLDIKMFNFFSPKVTGIIYAKRNSSNLFYTHLWGLFCSINLKKANYKFYVLEKRFISASYA